MNTNTAPVILPAVEPFHPQTNIFTVIMPDGTRRSVTKYREAWGVRYVSGSNWMQITHDYAVVYRGDVRAIDAVIRATMPIPSAPAPKAEKATPKPKAKRVCHCPVREIRRFWAIVKELGFDTRNKDAARAAIGRYFGRGVIEMKSLEPHEWFEAGTAMKRGWLVLPNA